MNTIAVPLPPPKRKKLSELLKQILYRVPPNLRNHWRDGDMKALRQSIDTHFHKGWRAKENWPEYRYQETLHNQMYRRLAIDRVHKVPWLDSVRKLDGLSILEIGCGTGASTVSLAEQGACVTGIDIDKDSLTVGRDRCAAYDVEANLIHANIVDFEFTEPYDLVIFFATLEHLTIEERLVSLRQIWEQMRPGSLLAITETPNRLWFFDNHTSELDFFNWLPDELAFYYSQFSSKGGFCDRYRELTSTTMEHFQRRGRGVSFHEFELAISEPLKVVSSLSTFHRFGRIGKPKDWAYKMLLKRIHPDLHDGWYEPSLNLIIQK